MTDPVVCALSGAAAEPFHGAHLHVPSTRPERSIKQLCNQRRAPQPQLSPIVRKAAGRQKRCFNTGDQFPVAEPVAVALNTAEGPGPGRIMLLQLSLTSALTAAWRSQPERHARRTVSNLFTQTFSHFHLQSRCSPRLMFYGASLSQWFQQSWARGES